MPIPLLNVHGDNYFYLKSKEKSNTLVDIATQASQDDLTDENLSRLKDGLSDIIGFREAAQIETYSQLLEVVNEERQRRLQIGEFHDAFFASALRAARDRVSNEYPNFSDEFEFNKDAIFLTLQRSALIHIYNLIFQENLDVNEVNHRLANGTPLMTIAPRLNVQFTDMLSFSMSNSLDRMLFLGELASTYGLDNETINGIENAIYFSVPRSLGRFLEGVHNLVETNEEIDRVLSHLFHEEGNLSSRWSNLVSNLNPMVDEDTLVDLESLLRRSHYQIGLSQPIKLGRALRNLVRGNNNIGSSVYRTGQCRNMRDAGFYPLAQLFLDNVDLRGSNKSIYYHTELVRASQVIENQFLRTETGIAQNILNFMAELTQIDPSDYITEWGTGRATSNWIIYPINTIPDHLLGQLYGLAVLGISSSYSTESRRSTGYENAISYSLSRRRTKSKEEIEGILYQFGRLGSPLHLSSIELDLADFYEQINQTVTQSTGQGVHEHVHIPAQFRNLIRTVENSEIFENPVFARNALQTWIDESSIFAPWGPRNYLTSYVDNGVQQRLIMLADTINLQLVPRDSRRKNSNLYRIANPEILQT